MSVCTLSMFVHSLAQKLVWISKRNFTCRLFYSEIKSWLDFSWNRTKYSGEVRAGVKKIKIIKKFKLKKKKKKIEIHCKMNL